MASDPTTPAQFLEQLINSRNRDLSVFLPLILGFSRRDNSSDSTDSANSPSSADSDPRGRIVLINPLTQGMIVIESNRSLEDMIREFAAKDGPKPASKSSIESMKKIVMSECEECPICLEEWEIGGEGREMPCGHKYHGGCIEKWLGAHGTCPVCRFKMPVDDEDESKKRSGDDGGEGEDRGRREEIWVSFAFSGRRDSSRNSNSEDVGDDNTDISS